LIKSFLQQELNYTAPLSPPFMENIGC